MRKNLTWQVFLLHIVADGQPATTFEGPSPVDYSGPTRKTVVMEDNFFNHIHRIFKYLYVFMLSPTSQDVLKGSLSKVSEVLPMELFLSWPIKYLYKKSSPSSPPLERAKGECFTICLDPHPVFPVHKAVLMLDGELGAATCTIAYIWTTVHGYRYPHYFMQIKFQEQVGDEKVSLRDPHDLGSRFILLKTSSS